MNPFWQFGIFFVLIVIAGLLNEVLGELRLAKKDREDAHSQRKVNE